MTVLRANTPKFVFQLLQTSVFQKQVAADLGATINSINGSNLLKYRFCVPPEPLEQKRIADSLSSLDDQIAAQAAKIETLKQHKRGLMQQLFPAPEEQ
jgi:type I restriction enzyme S subunit